jgi:hypothetical protein
MSDANGSGSPWRSASAAARSCSTIDMARSEGYPRRTFEGLIAHTAGFPNPDNFTEPTRDGFYELHHVVR